MALNDPAAELRSVAAHPYLLAADAAAGAVPVTELGPAELLDFGFGVADGLVELHSRGLVHGRIGSAALVEQPGGGLRLLLPPAPAGPPATAAGDVTAVRTALLRLLPEDDEDPLTRSTRAVLSDDRSTESAAALRDALAAVRLGRLPPRPSPPTSADVTAVSTPVGGVRVSPTGDPTPLQGQPSSEVKHDGTLPPMATRSAALATLAVVAVLIVVAVVVYLVLR